MTDLVAMGRRAASVKPILQKISGAEKRKCLLAAAEALEKRVEEILAANERDMENAVKNGMNPGLQDRLRLTAERVDAMAEGLRQIAELQDCVGEVMEEFERPNGLKIKKVRVPMGVIGIIYEARPNVTADAFGLCFKTGNVVILKGGSDALHSNAEIVRVLRETMENCGIPGDAIQLDPCRRPERSPQVVRLADPTAAAPPPGQAAPLLKRTPPRSKPLPSPSGTL